MKRIPNLKTILGAFLTASLLACSSLVFIFESRVFHKQEIPGPEAVAMTLLPAPTSTPYDALLASEAASPTSEEPIVLPTGQITVGTYVQISGTDGEGLHLRPSPGFDNEPLFLGYDAEVFLVTGGPQEKNDLIWWRLTALYDQERAGWAAAKYLSIISQP